MHSIDFNGQAFPLRDISIPEVGLVSVSTESLNDQLMTVDGVYTSNSACAIDERIYFYVTDTQIALSDKR